tara:strand:- start:2349 stop:2909 length:561 start_codon:yes stop_codon:yes gene_type:complete
MIIDNTLINVELLNGLLNNGWKGKWVIKQNGIFIENAIGLPLNKYVENNNFYYNSSFRLAVCLGIHMATLKTIGKGVFFFNLSDITVIDNNWYILSNTERVLPIIDNNNLLLSSIISFDGFLPPELTNIRTLPFKTNISCAYYSAALLIMHVLQIDNIDKLAHSPLYFFLQRCLVENPEKRKYLFV